AQQMWRGDLSSFDGKYVQAAEPLCSPMPISQPHPPILIGGGGMRKTLRLVARYADACNLFGRLPVWELANKLEALREDWEAEGRDYDAIEKTVLVQWDPLRKSTEIVNQIGRFSELGFGTVIASLRDVHTLKPIEALARDVFSQAAEL